MASQETRQNSSVRRNQYKELLELGSKIESTAENESAIQILNKIVNVAKRSDELNAQGRFQDRIENTTEVVMDAQVMKMSHELLGSLAQTMDNKEISDDEFTQQSKPIAVVQQPKEQQETQGVNETFNHIVKWLEQNNNKPLPYFKLIVDPENFMRTVQNAFKVSFLLRDGAIAIEEDEFGYPTVRPTEDLDKNGNYKERNHQMVSNLTTELCEEMIQRYHITEAMITWAENDA